MTLPTPDVKPNARRRPAPTPIELEKPLIDDAEDKETKPPTVWKAGVLVRPLTDIYETIGGFVLLADPVCGQAIIASASDAAKALDELARVNPKVRKVLMKMVSGGVTGKVVMAHLPIIMAVTAHHFPKVITGIQSVMLGKKTDVPD